MRNLVDLVGLGDLIDIVIVTTLVYTAVVWIRRTQARFVAIGLFVLAVLYVVAEAVDLQLTTWVLRSFFAISLVIVVVLFQEELRQLFERLGVWSMRRGRRAVAPSLPADILVEALTEMAHRRVGGLVVLPGTQPIARHVRGGLPLDGVVSVPLLMSIFDPHSPGHDGAVILEGDRVTRFAAHLPLSTNFVALAGVGTRHSAALGLAEVTDALCLVVSEERGEISVARDGALRRLAEPAGELTAEIARFLREKRPGAAERRGVFRPLVRAHWMEMVGSFLFVTALWFAVVPGSRPLQLTFRVPVRVSNLPPSLVLDEVKPAEVDVTLSGLRREFLFFNPRLLRVNVDAAAASAGRRTFAVADRDVRYPKALTLEGVDPDAVRIAVRPAPSQPSPEQPSPEQPPAEATS